MREPAGGDLSAKDRDETHATRGAAPADDDGSVAPSPVSTHARHRSTVNGGRIMSDVVPPASFSPHASAPSYLRGPVLHLFELKSRLLERIESIVDGPDGVTARFGFQKGPLGCSRVAIDGLVSDLVGGTNAVWGRTPDEAIAELHEKAFENFNRWARMVGGERVGRLRGMECCAYGGQYESSFPCGTTAVDEIPHFT